MVLVAPGHENSSAMEIFEHLDSITACPPFVPDDPAKKRPKRYKSWKAFRDAGLKEADDMVYRVKLTLKQHHLL
jgi:hypothetical protein